MKRAHASEQDLGEVVVAYLGAFDADVYQEVAMPGGVADIVARVGAETWIVEVKASLSLALLTQAMDRRRHAHRVFIAAPHTRNIGDVAALCGELGIGLLEVRIGDPSWTPDSRPWVAAPQVRCRVESRRWNTRPVRLTSRLRPEHKTHARAGAVGGGGRWTPFRDTCEQLARHVRSRPGITIAEAVERTKHHYATKHSAVSSLAAWIADGKVPGVRAERSHGTHGSLLLFPTEVR